MNIIDELKADVAEIKAILKGRQKSETVAMDSKEASAYLKIGRTKLYKLAQSREIHSKRVGDKYVFTKSNLDQWLHSEM